MAIVATNRYLQSLARSGTLNTINSETRLGLYTNIITPSSETVLADLDIEASGIITSWTNGLAVENGGWWVQDIPTRAFNIDAPPSGGDVTIRGWCLFGSSLIYAENMSPITIPEGEDRLIEIAIQTRARQV